MVATRSQVVCDAGFGSTAWTGGGVVENSEVERWEGVGEEECHQVDQKKVAI